MKKKIVVTTGTRSEYGILRPILSQISQSKKLELFLVVTGTHNSKKFGLTINEIKNDGFKIYKKIDMIPQGDSNYSMALTLGDGIKSFANIFKNLKPDINLILGDRTEMFASAIAAYYMNIPNAHIHGGDKTQGGIDEYTRHAITKISNIHFAASKKSLERILKMGEYKKNIFHVGSPGIDEIKQNKISNLHQLEKKYNFLDPEKNILLLYHSVTTETENTQKEIRIILNAIKKLKINTIAIAPNSDAGNNAIFQEYGKFAAKNDFFRVFKSLPRSDYLGFLKYFGALIGNSSSGIIEASYFQIPVINIGIRQKGREKGRNVIDVENPNSKIIANAISKSLKMKKLSKINEKLYGPGNSSKKIVEILEKIKLDKKLIQKQIAY